MLDSIRLPQQTIQVSMTSLILGDLFLYCCQSFQTECSHALIQEIISVLPMHRGGSGLHPFALMDGAFAGPWPNAALFIHTIVPQSYTICGRIYVQINSLPAGGAVGAVESKLSPVTLYTKQSSAHKRCFIRHYMQDEMKMTSKIFRKQLVSIRNTVI